MVGAGRAAGEPGGANDRSGTTNAGRGAAAAPQAGPPGPEARRSVPRERGGGCSRYFCASSFSISSMMEFISRIAALNGAEVVMSTPASLSRSIGYFDEPAASIAR